MAGPWDKYQPTTVAPPSGLPGAFVPAVKKQREAPTGYRWGANGQLEVIPGGPADKTSAPSTPPTGYRFKGDGNLEAIPGGPADMGSAQTPGDTTKTGEDYLATLPPELAGQVKALSDGRRAFPTGSALRSPQIQELIAAATQYDPSLDAANAATRVNTRKDFTSGKSAQNITALNTVLGHIGSFYQSAQELHNRGSRDWNAIANAVEPHLPGGFPALKGFNLSRQAVGDEMERVWRQSGGSEGEIKSWRKSLDSSSTPGEFRAAASKAIELLNSRLEALGAQYQQGMGKSADPLTFLKPHAQEIFRHLGPGGDGVLPSGPSGTPPTMGGGSGSSGGSPLSGNGGGGPDMTAATGGTKTVFDAATAAGLNALVQRGRPYAEAAAFAQSKGFPPPTPGEYAAALGWQKSNPNTPYNASNPTQQVPTTAREQLAASPVGSYFGGAADSITAGYSDELAGAAAAATGGDYTQARDAFNAQKNIQAQINPKSALFGNVTGGIMATVLPELAATKFAPGALALTAGKLGKFAPAATDAAYGALYGSGENNDNRLLGAAEGIATAVPVGAAARGATRGLANVISPPEGVFGPSYARGVFPTIGQRFGKSGLAGRIINTGEQALQSVPVLGSMVARARQIPRDAFQTGAFDEALGEIGQQLPPFSSIGTDAHAFASDAFSRAYDRARSGMVFAPDAPYLADEKAFAATLGDGTLDAAQAAQVRQRINTVVGSRLGSTAKQRAASVLQGDAYKNAASALQKTQREWSKTDPLKANALGDYLTIFDNAARRNSHPDAVAMLDQADRGYAKLVRVQNASARGGVAKEDGTFRPNDLSAAVKQESGGVRSGPYLRGEALMQDYANAGRGLADTLPNSGTADRLYTGQAIAGGAGTMFGAPAALAAHPGSLAVLAPYLPGVNKLVTRTIAPRKYTLPPNVAAVLANTASQVENLAPYVGRLSVPGALGWSGQ